MASAIAREASIGSVEPETKVNIIVLGDQNVGKTAMLSRYRDNRFVLGTMPSVGVEFNAKIIEAEGWLVKATFWDTAGQERYDSMTTSFVRTAEGAVIVYDITNKSSLSKAKRFRDLVEEFVPGCPIVVVGNKSDLDDAVEVSTEDGQAFADMLGCPYFFETSAKTNHNIAAAFERIAILTAEKVSPADTPVAALETLDLEAPAAEPDSCVRC